MIFRSHVPSPPLSHFVEFLWYYGDLQVNHTKERLIPDAAMELIIDLTETPKKLYRSRDTTKFTNYRRCWVSGMHREYIVIGAAPGSSMMGAHFRAGGAAPFFGFPISELAGAVVELDLIWKREILALRERLLETPGIDEKFRMLEQYLLGKAESRCEPDRMVNAALHTLRSWPMVSLRGLAAQLGMSQRQMIARFDSRVGLTPKLMSRVFRFQKALQAVHGSNGEIDWPGLALDYGYYDQAHFIHEFQEFTGVTPAFYARHRTEYPNYLYVD
ncbi:MAG: AraC family transcriptional regulator [Candidatus Acidiferrales bacterium]